MQIACNAKADTTGDLERDIDASTNAIDEMVREVTKNLFIDMASAYVTGKVYLNDYLRNTILLPCYFSLLHVSLFAGEAATKEGVANLVHAAVYPRLESLNATFLPIINSYIEAVNDKGEDQKDVLGVLLAIKAEVLSQLANRLPPEMRTIQRALEASGS